MVKNQKEKKEKRSLLEECEDMAKIFNKDYGVSILREVLATNGKVEKDIELLKTGNPEIAKLINKK